MTTPLTVGRDPAAEKRTREFQQRVAQILNSLGLEAADGSGTLLLLHLEGVNRVGLAGLFFHGNGPPPQSLAFIGDYYLDVANGIIYRKVS